ncbi:hypothetical protein CF326_g7502 [Tilletia indica]|nr:hypothetical protein CF326_g7502 [Tilletia indica]
MPSLQATVESVADYSENDGRSQDGRDIDLGSLRGSQKSGSSNDEHDELNDDLFGQDDEDEELDDSEDRFSLDNDDLEQDEVTVPHKLQLAQDHTKFTNWATGILNMPTTAEYPLFPQGELWLKFMLSSCDDFRSLTDWCWRHRKRGKLDHPKPLGPGVWRRLVCQGVLQCSHEDCLAAVRVPAQGTRAQIQKRIKEGCRVCFRKGRGEQKLVHHGCSAQLFFYTYSSSDIGILQHEGTHDHAKPDQRKLPPSGKAKLKEAVLKYPHTKAFGLATGMVKAGSGAVIPVDPLRSIGEPLVNVDRAAALRRQILKDAGIRANGSRDGPLIQFLDMQGDGKAGNGVAIRHAELLGNSTRIVIQTDWQREMFLRRDDMTGRESRGQAGVLTDVTYSVFTEFYLCGSSVFSVQLRRWIPVLWTVLRQQRDEDFAFHFTNLFNLAADAGKTRLETELMLMGVVDFSQAQLNGFRAAYKAWRIRLLS